MDATDPTHSQDEIGLLVYESGEHWPKMTRTSFTQAVAVYSPHERLEFTRTTCLEYLPYKSHEQCRDAGFTLPAGVDPNRPINKYIIPPLSRAAATESFISASNPTPPEMTPRILRLTSGPRKPSLSTYKSLAQIGFPLESYITVRPSDLVCTAFLTSEGVYEIVASISPCGLKIASADSHIYAPSAWKNAATVIANFGQTGRNKTRLCCQLHCGRLVCIDWDKDSVAIADGWVANGWKVSNKF